MATASADFFTWLLLMNGPCWAIINTALQGRLANTARTPAQRG